MRVLFICTTPYHVLVSTKIMLVNHDNDIVDILITDAMANPEVMTENIRKCNMFNRVYLYRRRRYVKKWYESDSFIDRILIKFKPYFIKVNVLVKDLYDIIYLPNNYDWVMNQILKYNRIKLQNLGRTPSYFLYEDGTQAYSKENEIFFEKFKRPISKFLCKKKYDEYLGIKGIFMFIPKLIEWKPDFPVHTIEKISQNDDAFVDTVNKIFNFTATNDNYSKKFLFFEDCYFADGKDIGDIEVINDIVSIIGKEALYVKIHPRNPINRFKKIGIETNTNTEIPWEVIALNMNLEDKVLITISSSAVLNILSNINVRPKLIIMLTEYKKINKQFLHEVASGFQMTLADMNKDIIKRPKTYNELADLLRIE